MADIGEIKVPIKVSFEAIQGSPELEKLLRQIIREELRHLEPDVANSLLEQLVTRLGRQARIQERYSPDYEVKTVPLAKKEGD